MGNFDRYRRYYTDEALWAKLAGAALAAGRGLVRKALTLYYAARSPETPLWAKTVIFGALGYFILPLDAIPDIAPLVGFSDDLATLGAAALTVASCVKKEHADQADAALGKWFAPKVIDAPPAGRG